MAHQAAICRKKVRAEQLVPLSPVYLIGLQHGWTIRKKKTAFKPSFLKAPIRIELMHNGFADRSLTAWAWRHGCYTIAKSDLFV